MAPETIRGGRVAAVEPGAAADAGVRPGDVLLSVDGQVLRDVIDWQWLTGEPSFALDVMREGTVQTLHVERSPGEALGVIFADVLFDGVRPCENACSFCFVSGLPTGLRPALYVRDDDFRLSFLVGNFVTLTNMSDADVARIVEQRLSPLHVSVHAVDEDVRRELICPTGDDRALEILDHLLDAGIEAHVQVVLVPHVNDGAVLERTLRYLSQRPGVLSVGVVPMGYTAHQRRWKASYDRESAAAVLALVAGWSEECRASRGVGWVYPADEFVLLAEAGIPAVSAYDDFPQFENGIGMVRAFLDEFEAPSRVGEAVAITGELFAPVLRKALAAAGVSGVRVLAVRNRLFGGNVTVTGLLSGRDIIDAIEADGGRGPYLVPDVVVNSDGLLLDDVPAASLCELTGADVRVIGSDAASLADALGALEGSR